MPFKITLAQRWKQQRKVAVHPADESGPPEPVMTKSVLRCRCGYWEVCCHRRGLLLRRAALLQTASRGLLRHLPYFSDSKNNNCLGFSGRALHTHLSLFFVRKILRGKAREGEERIRGKANRPPIGCRRKGCSPGKNGALNRHQHWVRFLKFKHR